MDWLSTSRRTFRVARKGHHPDRRAWCFPLAEASRRLKGAPTRPRPLPQEAESSFTITMKISVNSGEWMHDKPRTRKHTETHYFCLAGHDYCSFCHDPFKALRSSL